MKKVYLAGIAATALFLGSCGENSSSDDNILGEVLTDTEDFDAAIKSFGEGGATDGREYFDGVLAEVVEVDVKFREVLSLDDMDATEEEIVHVLDSAIHKIAEGRRALKLYEGENWPKRAEMHDLTIEWFDAVEDLINDYLYDLAGPMSTPDEEWTDENFAFYDEYVDAYEAGYLEVDSRWVDFQYEYAAANGFEISGTIDEDAMVEEQLEHDVE